MPDLPPRYVVVPSDLLYDPDISRAEMRTGLRIWGLGWKHNYARTEPMSFEALCDLCEVGRSQMYGHLAALKSKGVLRFTSLGDEQIVFELVGFPPDFWENPANPDAKHILGSSAHPESNPETKTHKNGRGGSPAEPDRKAMFQALASVCRYDLDTMTDKQRGQLNQSEKRLRGAGATPSDLVDFQDWWYRSDWRGRKGQPPAPHQVREEWGRFKRGGAVRLKVVPGHCPKCGGKAEGRFCPECSLHW